MERARFKRHSGHSDSHPAADQSSGSTWPSRHSSAVCGGTRRRRNSSTARASCSAAWRCRSVSFAAWTSAAFIWVVFPLRRMATTVFRAVPERKRTRETERAADA